MGVPRHVLRGAFGIADVTAKALTTKERHALPKSDFALPESKSYPIHDIEHARNALARVAANGTAEEQRRVRSAVKRRYPGLKNPAG